MSKTPHPLHFRLAYDHLAEWWQKPWCSYPMAQDMRRCCWAKPVKAFTRRGIIRKSERLYWQCRGHGITDRLIGEQYGHHHVKRGTL